MTKKTSSAAPGRDLKTTASGKTLARTSRLRPAATVAFPDEDRDDSCAEGIENDDEEAEDAEEDAGSDEFLVLIMKEMQKRKATASTRSADLQRQKKALFSAARKNANELVRVTNLHVNEALAKIIEMKNQEVPYQKCLGDVMPLLGVLDETVGSLLDVYPPLIDDLSSRRVEAINAASSMLENNPIEREKVRKRLMKDAYAQLNQNLENERIATDATSLIKHYKALMLS